MTTATLPILLLLLFFLISSVFCTFPFTTPRHPVIMISFDGFRHDYLDIIKAKGYKTPNFDFLIRQGTKAKFMKNAFITKTFPNHYTLVTGMYEESHGVVSNNMFDPRYNLSFDLSMANKPSPTLNKWFNNDTTGNNLGPEPIWVTNQKADKKDGPIRRSGVVMWPGSAAEIHGATPYKFQPYNVSIGDNERVDMIIKWLTSKEDPINLGLLYFNQPDKFGHKYGPYSKEVADVIVKLDALLGYLIDSLQKHDLDGKVNLIVTSDHGMSEIRNITVMEDYGVTPDMYDAYGSSPVFSVWPKGEENVSSLYDKLKKVPNLTVWKRDEIPRKYYYTYNERILPILIKADDHYQICAENCNLTLGNHGFSNDNDNMHPIFFAHGPSFKVNHTVKEFDNVNVYGLLCNLLGVTPAPYNGSIEATADMLRNESKFSLTGITFFAAVLFATVVSLIVCVAVVRNTGKTHHVHLGGAEHSPLLPNEKIP